MRGFFCWSFSIPHSSTSILFLGHWYHKKSMVKELARRAKEHAIGTRYDDEGFGVVSSAGVTSAALQ
jgi:hypothetical protein